MNFLNSFIAGYHDVMENKSDQRTKNYPMMGSPLPTIGICLAYVFCAKVVGPKLMQNRKPFIVKKAMVYYNIVQVIFNTFCFVELCRLAWFNDYNYRCQPVDTTRSYRAMRLAFGSWLFYLNKFADFLDTIFFIMRKRFDQVSTLHVIHHGIMPISLWFGVKFTPDGHSSFFALCNSFVHMVMYSYYLLAAMGPKVQKYLWWKKYLTMIQMAQFVACFFHAIQLMFYNPCNFPIAFSYMIAAHSVMFYSLFWDFYKKAYSKMKKDN